MMELTHPWQMSHRTQRLINRSEHVFLQKYSIYLAFSVCPIVLDWNSWFFARWAPGFTTTICQHSAFCSLYKMSRFHVAVHLFSYRSQKMSKRSKNISDTRAVVCHFSLTHFNVICDLLLKKCKVTWDLFVKVMIFKIKKLDLLS